MEAEPQFFVPILLLFGKKDERTTAVPAFGLNIAIVGGRHRCWCLTVKVGFDGGIGNDLFLFVMPWEVDFATFKIGTQASNSGVSAKSRVLCKI